MRRITFLFITIFIGTLLFAQNAPLVYNVIGSQRTDGSKIIDIYYSVSDSDGDTLSVSLKVSADNGTTFDITPTDSLLSGDVGSGILSGNDKHIIWNAGEEDFALEGITYKFKIIANDDPNAFPAGFVFLQGGTFQMGDRLSEGYSSEYPLHNVTLDDFYISKTLITQSDYAAIMGSNPAHDYGVGDNYPVYDVTWFDAIKYCNKKSINENLTPSYSVNGDTNPDNWGTNIVPDVNWNANGYRLPTEAEWEYAARGGVHESDNYRYSGCNEESDLPNYAWYSANNSPNGTKEVATKLPNQLGLYDMSGNVYDWCWDWYSGNYYSSSPSLNPHGPDSETYRVIRGGSWSHNAAYSRVAFRYIATPSNQYYGVGFHVVRVLQ